MSQHIIPLTTTLRGSSGGLEITLACDFGTACRPFWFSCSSLAALVSILYPMMATRNAGTFNGLAASGGIIAPVIPPSIPLILVRCCWRYLDQKTYSRRHRSWPVNGYDI
ncbi:hypothetical protein O9993_11885 [Vibrio lentus]|nr:hypothetical protein [Vibrio lentus]